MREFRFEQENSQRRKKMIFFVRDEKKNNRREYTGKFHQFSLHSFIMKDLHRRAHDSFVEGKLRREKLDQQDHQRESFHQRRKDHRIFDLNID